MIFLYTGLKTEIGERLEKAVRAVAPENKIDICRSIEALYRIFSQRNNRPSVAVLLAADIEDLLGFVSIRTVFRNSRIILILPDQQEATVAQGHKLCPRYVSYTESDFTDVATVLAKMIESGNELSTDIKQR
jgi:hypothetical protein